MSSCCAGCFLSRATWFSRSNGTCTEWQVECCLEFLVGIHRWATVEAFRILGQGSVIIQSQILLLWKVALELRWALMETERLTVRHKLTMWAESIIMIWVLSDPLSHKVRMYSYGLSLIGTICDQARRGPEDISKLREDVTHIPVASLPAILPLFHSMLRRSVDGTIRSVVGGKN